MRAFQATTTRSFGLRVALPAVLILLGTLAAVVLSLTEITERAERLEDARLARAAQAAVGAFVDRVGDAQEHYARADMADAALGETAAGFIAAATSKGTLFDTAYVLDADGNDVLAFQKGWHLTEPSRQAFGSGLAAAL